MSKRKVRGVPPGPRVDISEVHKAILDKLVDEDGESVAESACERSKTEHLIEITFDGVSRDFEHLELPGMTLRHTVEYKDWSTEYADESTVTIFAGKGAIAVLDHTMGEYSDEDCDACLSVLIQNVPVGQESRHVNKHFAKHVNHAIAPVLKPDAAPIILESCAKLLAQKQQRGALKNAVPAIQKVARLLTAAT